MPKLSSLFVALLLCFILAVPTLAKADAPQDPCTGSGAMAKMNDEVKQNLAATGQQIIQAQNAALALFGEVDVKAQSCWEQMKNLFSTIGGLSDPLGLIWSMVSQQLMNMLNQLCSTALSSLDQLKNAALSQFNRLCLPLPDFGLNLNLNLNLKSVTCNGVSLYQPGAGSNGNVPLIYDFRSLFPKGQ